ncbi:MAG: hypothetical protein A2V70_12795 [Planctomycetes bacterium RBG_13_63_9]|nr:MAG: hypothetical protein A2V70_12795 [Planctomycetes bacterium RBG_13_63_9]
MTGRNGSPAEDPHKHRAILDQAIRTFAEVGFRGADVQVIADRAGVGKGTVYRYFGNKEDLFWATTFEVLEQLDRHMLQAMEGIEGAAEKIRAACVAHGAFFEANPQHLEVFVQDRAEFRGAAPQSHLEYHEKMIARFAKIFEQGVADGEFRPMDTRKAVVSLGGVLHGTTFFHCYSKIDQTLTEMSEYAVDIFLRGIRAPVRQGVQGNLQ